MSKLNEILNKISIPNEKCIKGSIYLPLSIDEASIEWSSSRPEVISDKVDKKKAPGVVKRELNDCEVTLICRVSIDGESATKEFALNVCGLREHIKEEDYAGYLFAHFIGEENENSEQIYFSVSQDGLHFKDMHNLKPVLTSNVGEKGVRDPYICRSHDGDRFFMVATDLSIYNRGGWKKNEQGYYDPSTTGSDSLVFWESDDLINWSEPRLLKVAPTNAGMAWAPEMVYNDETDEYIIFFSSSIMNPETKYKAKPNTIFYVATRDFIHFSKTDIFIDNQCDGDPENKAREIIDTTVIKVGNYYYSASKDGDNDEACGGIRIMKNTDLLNPNGWEKVLDLDELGLNLSGLDINVLDNTSLEGPELFIYNKKDWADSMVPEYGIIADQYMAGTGYLPLKTTDFEDKDNKNGSWKVLSKEEYSFDKLKKRHGTIINITEKELENLKQL